MVLDHGNEVNILIIGNGLDISLGYPTKYADFLNFCEDFVAAFYLVPEYIEQLSNDEIIEKYGNVVIRMNAKDLPKNIKSLTLSLQKYIKENWWIDYFRKRYRDKKLGVKIG